MRRLGIGLMAALVAISGVLVLPAAAAGAAEDDGSGVSVIRYGGADRYETSLQVAEAVAAEAGGSLSSVVLVSGRRWTDAVVAAPVAGALGAPVLMTPPDELRADALQFLQRVGVSSAVVVGPDASGGGHGPGRGVGAGVLAALEAAGISAVRVAGDDRFGTGVAAVERVTPGAMGGLGRTVIVASGEVFADALVAGPYAARGSHPVLLTPPGELHAGVAAYLGGAEISHVVLMGGTAALSEAVERSVKDLGIDVTRVAGSTRYDTAVKAAELVTGRYADAAGEPCFATSTIGVARARVPFDSFSAAPLLGRLCAPLVLADPGKIPADTAGFLDAAREQHDVVALRVFGGDAAVSQAAIDAYRAGEEPDDGTATGDEADSDEADSDEPSTAPGVLPAGTCGGAIDDEPVQLVPSTDARDAAWSPDCSELVYSQDGSLWTVSNDGIFARELVRRDGNHLHSPAWSPDGTRVAYVRDHRNDDGHWLSHIWTVNIDGGLNSQRTEGDVVDRWPAWSPDSSEIAFERLTGSGRDEHGQLIDADRHIVVMTSSGDQPRALNEGGRWEQSPAWSPDGTQLAYEADGYVVVSEPDGSNPRRLHAGVYVYGGLSWSPDGQRIAFTRGDGTATSIVIADIDGIAEETVFDEGLRALNPRWSPDGQRIAFRTIDDEDKHRVYVVGASGEPPPIAADCRPAGTQRGTTAGFPLPDWAPSARGTLRVAVLFVDFPDAQAAHTTQQEAARSLEWAEEYLEKSSYRKLDLEWVPHHQWLRTPEGYQHYLGVSAIGTPGVAASHERGEAFYQDVLQLADDDVDFSGVHSVAVILPSTHFGGGVAGGSIEADGQTLPAHLVGVFPKDEPGELRDWGATAVHELAHNLGLLDMYPYDGSVRERPDAPDRQEWISIDFGRMGLSAYFLAAEEDERLQRRGRRADGSTWTDYVHRSRAAQEMLAWSRWQLGWLHERQAACVIDDEATVTLAPIARTGGAVAMAAVPIDHRRVIVIESRRRIGYDRDSTYTWPDGGSARWRALLEEGVLVYTVDTIVGSGQLPVKIAGDAGNGQVEDYPVLQPGESVTVFGYTIAVTADDGDTHTVSITRSS